jgi:3-phenylpropionate/trans-cinnamate dioxygenase ferredoxin reductase component
MIGRIVVIGGGIAGVSTVAALRAGGFDGELTLVDAGELPYDQPPLSKEFLKGDRDIKQIALQPEQWYVEHSVRLLNRTTATAVRPGTGRVELPPWPD